MQETQRQVEPLGPPCPSCGAALRGQPAFCPACGLPLAATTGQLPSNRLLAGRYRVIQLLARGGMGAVYLAEDTRLANAQVAVKEMSSAFTRGDTAAFERAVTEFEREAAMLARLRHPHLPRVSDRFEEDGKHFLVMEYIHGETLRQLAARAGGRLPLAQALDFVDQLCDVLAYLHSQEPPIIYRDLKPANVMVVAGDASRVETQPHTQQPRTPQIVLIDFGIARFYRPGLNSDTAVYGTIGYAPPEQYGKGQTDARTDIYALGVLLHHLLTGHDPSGTPFALPPPRALDPAIPAPVAAAIERATANDREARFADIAAFRAALRTPAAPTPPDRRTIVDTAPARSRRGLWLATLVGGIVLALLLAALLGSRLLTPRQSGPAPTTAAQAAAAPTAASQPNETPDASQPTSAPAPTEPAGAIAGPATTAAEPEGLIPARVSASGNSAPGIDGQGNPVTYEPTRAVDGRADTAWRVDGDGAGQWIELDFGAEVQVQKIGIIPGYDKIDPFDGSDRFAQNRVVKRVRLEFAGGASAEASFAQDRQMQFVTLPAAVRTRTLRVVILETYPPPPQESGGRDFTPISEIKVEGIR
jgi:serine/threonine-protein kinase